MYSERSERNAEMFCNAIRLFTNKPDNIDNFENYLIYNFDEWLEKYGNSPEDLASEMKFFAEMEF